MLWGGLETLTSRGSGQHSEGSGISFYQLASGRVMLAPFLKERWEWVESDICWCGTARQTRENCFKGRKAWKQEIKRLWKGVGEASVEKGRVNNSHAYKGKKGFRYGVRKRKGPDQATPLLGILWRTRGFWRLFCFSLSLRRRE